MNFLFFFLQPVQTPDVLIDPVVSLSDFFRNIDRLEFLAGLLITMDDEYVFTGDYMLLDDETTLRLRGGDPEAYENIAIPIMQSIPNGMKVCPGHGPSYVKGEENEPH